jgi:hypothetical protein
MGAPWGLLAPSELLVQLFNARELAAMGVIDLDAAQRAVVDTVIYRFLRERVYDGQTLTDLGKALAIRIISTLSDIGKPLIDHPNTRRSLADIGLSSDVIDSFFPNASETTGNN